MEIQVYSGDIPPHVLKGVAELYRQVFSGPPRFESYSEESALEEMRKFTDAGADLIVVVNDEKVLAACALGLPLDKYYNSAELIEKGAPADSYYFANLWTHPQFRNQGLGSSLHAAREEQARARGHRVATVRCRADNATNLGLLARAGFKEIARYESTIAGSVAERVVLAKELA